MTEVDGLQTVLAGAHAAAWGYSLAGARLSGDAADRAAAGYEAVRDLRDATVTLLTEREAEPVAAEPAYQLPFEVSGPDSARRLAVHLEDRLAPLLADLVAAAKSDAVRVFAADALTASGLRRLGWDASPTAFPGL